MSAFNPIELIEEMARDFEDTFEKKLGASALGMARGRFIGALLMAWQAGLITHEEYEKRESAYLQMMERSLKSDIDDIGIRKLFERKGEAPCSN